MKTLAIIVSLAALSGCATTYPGPANYGSRAYAQGPDADGWQVVSVTPVPAGTGASSANAGVITTSPAPAPVYAAGSVVSQPYYGAAPVYVPAPIYAPAPVYVDPWYPPISIGLGFSWSHWSGGGHRGGWGGRGGWRGHR
jgi:hypothetical protein